MSQPCAIWGTRTIESDGSDQRSFYDSPRAGGKYEISGSAKATVQHLQEHQKAKLTSWLVDQRLGGNEQPIVTDREVQRAKNSIAKSVRERRDHLLRIIFSRLSALGEKLKYEEPAYLMFPDSPIPENSNWAGYDLLMAATESVVWAEVQALIDFASEQGLLKDNSGLSLTFDGHAHLEALRATPNSSSQAFIAMWFGSEVAAAYDDGIAPAVMDSGHKPMRIDRKEHNNKIDDEIIAEIRRSRFVVADFTCGMVGHSGGLTAIPRGGVYYEAGFAQGLGIPVIWMCRQDHIDHVHFDTRQFNHITWTTPQDLREKLYNRIGAVLGDGPLVSGS